MAAECYDGYCPIFEACPDKADKSPSRCVNNLSLAGLSIHIAISDIEHGIDISKPEYDALTVEHARNMKEECLGRSENLAKEIA